jgi:hypothetical protein
MSGHFGHPAVQPLADLGDAIAVFANAALGSVVCQTMISPQKRDTYRNGQPYLLIHDPNIASKPDE